MNALLRSLTLFAVAPIAAFAINTYNVYTDASGTIQFFEPDGTTKFTDSYVFEVGVFSGATDFNVPSSIAASFSSFGSTVNWDPNLLDAGVGGASLSFSFDETTPYPAGVTQGAQLYIWAYDTKAITETSDWVIITNPNWIVQPLATGANVDARDYTITDSGTAAVYGSLSASQAITEFTASAIPEPSSFAAIAGLGMLGFAAMRKRRRA